jgi:putative phage-type endonuclease
MTVVACDQRSPEWHAARLGKLTGSRAADAFTVLKSGGESAARRNLRLQLVLERLTGTSQESGYVNADMERGILLEPDACAAYEAETGILVQAVGFVAHDELAAGCSPDGLTGDGLIEIKCPRATTHLEYVRGGLPTEYRTQMTHGLWLTGAAWADFVSYHPQFPPALQLKVTRLYARDLDLAAYELMVRMFLGEVDRELAQVQTLAAPTKVA